ncbi:hypothetical protein RHMOL_Rhmol05G0026900 [Rhododendron molle]|uniref:Uncharacterized protein n=1 Tax=Rhododendron molle TaxID=49168 RepID=A0ACC0NJQ0_RHOML|nr:hypothetical protein RHMOL_Rhmol05G0026900 [Rhododendron molle]
MVHSVNQVFDAVDRRSTSNLKTNETLSNSDDFMASFRKREKPDSGLSFDPRSKKRSKDEIVRKTTHGLLGIFDTEKEDDVRSDVPSQESKCRIPFSTIIGDAMREYSPREFATPLEPLLRSVAPAIPLKCNSLRRVVREEVERTIVSSFHSSSRTSLNQSESSKARVWQLHFVNKLRSTLFTGCRIEAVDCNPVTIVIRDSVSGEVISSGPLSSLRIEIVVLNGDFGADYQEDWTEKEFNANLVRERDGKRPLVTGELVITLRDGVGYVGDASFTDNSSWIRSRKFRLGVRPFQSKSPEVRIREARSEAFIVKDPRGESYKKHHPPNLNDEVWRLEKIAKGGTYHKALLGKGITTVEQFLQLYSVDPSSLRLVLGGMSNKVWETVTEHATGCVLDDKLYIYYKDGERNGVLFNSIFRVVGATFDGQSFQSRDMLNEFQMGLVGNLTRHAYKNLDELVPLDAPPAIGPAMVPSSQLAEPYGSSRSQLQDVNFPVMPDSLAQKSSEELETLLPLEQPRNGTDTDREGQNRTQMCQDAHLGRAYKGGPIMFNSEKKDMREGLNGECLTKSAISFDDTTDRKTLPDHTSPPSLSELTSKDFDDFDHCAAMLLNLNDEFGDGLLSSCGDEQIIKSTTNHVDQHDAALLPLVNMDTYVHMSSTQLVALPDGGEIVQLESSEKKPGVDFDATNSRAHQSGVLVSNSENQNMREASKRWCMTESVVSITNSKTRISSMDYDPPDNRAHLLRAHQSGPIVFNSEKKDWREELHRECFTKSVLSLDDSTKQKALLDFDATENKALLFRENQSGPVVSLSENKSRGEALKRECITKNMLGLEDLQQHCGDRCDDAAKTFGAIYDSGFHKPDSLARKSFEELETLPTEEQPIDCVPLLAQGKLTLEGCVQQEISQELPIVMQIKEVEQRVTKMPRYLGGLTAQSASSSRWPIGLPDGGHIMLLDPLDQSAENIEHVARVDQCSPTVFLAEKKMLKKTLKRKCRSISVIFEENDQHFGRICAGAAKSLGAMRIRRKNGVNQASALKQIHTQHGIHQWPFQQKWATRKWYSMGDESPFKVSRVSMDEKLDSRLQFIRMSQFARSSPRALAFPDRGEIVGPTALSSSEFAATNNKAHLVGQGQSSSTASHYQRKNMRETSDKQGLTMSLCSVEDLEQPFGCYHKDAVKNLGDFIRFFAHAVSVSMFKSSCRQHWVYWWQCQSENKVPNGLKMKSIAAIYDLGSHTRDSFARKFFEVLETLVPMEQPRNATDTDREGQIWTQMCQEPSNACGSHPIHVDTDVGQFWKYLCSSLCHSVCIRSILRQQPNDFVPLLSPRRLTVKGCVQSEKSPNLPRLLQIDAVEQELTKLPRYSGGSTAQSASSSHCPIGLPDGAHIMLHDPLEQSTKNIAHVFGAATVSLSEEKMVRTLKRECRTISVIFENHQQLQPIALPDGGELDSSVKKPVWNFVATTNRAYQSGILVSYSEEKNMREASKRLSMTESVISLGDSTTRTSSTDSDATDNRAHLVRPHQSGPIAFNSEKKDTREGLLRECLTKNVLSLDDSTKQKLLLDFHSTENEAHLFRAYQSGPVVSLSENKSRGDVLKRECITKSKLVSEDLEQHCGGRRDDAAKRFNAIYDPGFHTTDSLERKSFEALETILPREQPRNATDTDRERQIQTQICEELSDAFEQPNDCVPLLSLRRLKLKGCVQLEKSPYLRGVLQIDAVEQGLTKSPGYSGGSTSQPASSSHWPIGLLDGGNVVLLDPLEQSTKNVTHAAKADLCSHTVSLSKKKMVRESLQRKCKTMTVDFEDHRQHFGRRCEDKNKILGAMRICRKHGMNWVSTGKRIHKPHWIHWWQFRQSASSLHWPIGLPAGGHIVTLSKKIIVRKTFKRECRTVSIGFEDHQQHFGSRCEGAANSRGANHICMQHGISLVPTVKRIRRQHGIHRSPFRQGYSLGGQRPAEVNSVSIEEELVSRLQFLHMSLLARSSLRPLALPSGSECVEHIAFSLSEFAGTNNGAHPGRQDRCGSSASRLEKGGTMETPNRDRIALHVFGFKYLQQHFGSKHEFVAKSLGVHVSSFKCTTRHHGIHRWPNRIRNNVWRRPDPHGEKNPSPMFKTLSNGQIAMENDMDGQNPEPNEFLLDSFADLNFWNTENGSIAGIENPNARVFPQPQIASTEVLNENMESSEDRRNFLDEHVSQSSDLTFLACSDSQLVATILHTMPAIPHMLPQLTGRSCEPFHREGQSMQSTAYANINALVFPQPKIALTQILSVNMGNLEDWRASKQESLLEGHVSGSINSTVSTCSGPSPSQQPMPTTSYTVHRIPHMLPPFTAVQDTSFVQLKATYGDTIIEFQLPLTYGIIEMKVEVAMRLKLELDSFDVKYTDEEGDWILISCNEGLRNYLQLFSSLVNPVIRLLVVDKDDVDPMELKQAATFEESGMDSDYIGIIYDLWRFVSKEFYRKAGKAGTRFYLLYEPPGADRSSLIAAIANYPKFDIFDLDLTSMSSILELKNMLSSTTNRSLIAIQDFAHCAGMLPNLKNELTVSCLLKYVEGLFTRCGDERIIVVTTNHRDRHDDALLPLVNMDIYIPASSPQPVALQDGGEIVQLESLEQKPLVDFDATDNRAYQSDVLVSNSKNNGTGEVSKRLRIMESALHLVDPTSGISSTDFDAPDNGAHLVRAYLSGPIMFNSEKNDAREELNGQCLTKSVLSLDDSTKRKSLPDFDATENKAHVVKAYQSGRGVSLSEKKIWGEALKRECSAKRILELKDLQQHCGGTRDATARSFSSKLLLLNKIQICLQSLSVFLVFNHASSLFFILPGYVDLEMQSASSSCWPTVSPDGGHLVLLDPLEQSTKNVAHVARADQCSPTVALPKKKMLRRTLKKKCRLMSTIFEILQQHFGRKYEGSANSFGAARICRKHGINRLSTVKRIHDQYRIRQWPFRQVTYPCLRAPVGSTESGGHAGLKAMVISPSLRQGEKLREAIVP